MWGFAIVATCDPEPNVSDAGQREVPRHLHENSMIERPRELMRKDGTVYYNNILTNTRLKQ